MTNRAPKSASEQQPRPISERDLRIVSRREVMLDHRISTGARVLFFALDDFFDPIRGEVWWRWRKLVVSLGMSTPTFFRLMAELIEKKVVEKRVEGRRSGYIPVSRSFSKMRMNTLKNENETGLYLITDPGSSIQFPLTPASGGKTPHRGKQYLCPRCRDRGHKRGVECECVIQRRRDEAMAMEAATTQEQRAAAEAQWRELLINEKPNCDICKDVGRRLLIDGKLCTCEAAKKWT